MSTTPIADYALLSDRHSAALVSRDGSIDWLCFPRFDSPSIFGRLLGDEAGHWSIRATDATEVTRRYLDRTMVLETTFRTPDGHGHRHRRPGHGRGQPGPRARQGCAASSAAAGDLRRRGGRVVPGVRPAPRVRARPSSARGRRRWTGRLRGCRRAGPLLSRSPDGRPSAASGRLHLRRGESAGFALHHAKRAEAGTARVWSQSEIAARLDDTVSAWESWSELHQAYVGPWRDLVHHSGRVLQALSFPPTGAICAAATTSLPETVGGSPELGLPLHLGPGCLLHHRGPVGGGLSRRGQRVLRLHDHLCGRLPRPGRRPADHVRHRRRTGPDRTGAAPLGGLAALCPRSRRQRRLEPAPARRLRRTAQRRVPPLRPPLRRHLPAGRAHGRPRQVGCAPRPGPGHHDASSSNWPTPRPGAGRKRTRGSGRSGASPATSCTPS